jgi:hypothetical protein
LHHNCNASPLAPDACLIDAPSSPYAIHVGGADLLIGGFLNATVVMTQSGSPTTIGDALA